VLFKGENSAFFETSRAGLAVLFADGVEGNDETSRFAARAPTISRSMAMVMVRNVTPNFTQESCAVAAKMPDGRPMKSRNLCDANRYASGRDPEDCEVK